MNATAAALVRRLCEDSDVDSGAKDLLLNVPYGWALRLKAEIEAKDGQTYDFPESVEDADVESRVFLVTADAERTPVYAMYRDTDAMRPDVFNTVYEQLQEAPEHFSDDFLVKLVDFRALIRTLGVDEHTRHLRTRGAVIDYYSDIYGDTAYPEMLRAVPPGHAQLENAASDVSKRDRDALVGWLVGFRGHAIDTGGDGPLAVQFDKLARVIQLEFED